jgi:hypothetical protein
MIKTLHIASTSLGLTPAGPGALKATQCARFPPGIKREVGENPTRTRRCKLGAPDPKPLDRIGEGDPDLVMTPETHKPEDLPAP